MLLDKANKITMDEYSIVWRALRDGEVVCLV